MIYIGQWRRLCEGPMYCQPSSAVCSATLWTGKGRCCAVQMRRSTGSENKCLLLCVAVVVVLTFLLILSGNIEVNPGPKNMTIDTDEVHKVLLDVLVTNYANLSAALKTSLHSTAEYMYSSKLITETTKNAANYSNLIDEFKSGLLFRRNLTDLELHCQSFLDCLVCQGGPPKEAAHALAANWKEQIHQQINISFNINIKFGLEEKSTSLTNAEQINITTHSKDHVNCCSTSINGVITLLSKDEEEIKGNLIGLHKHFGKIMRELKHQLKVSIDQGTTVLSDIIDVIHNSIGNGKDLRNCETVDNFMETIDDTFDFLDCRVVTDIAEEYATLELSNEFQTHLKEAEKLRSSTSVKTLREQLHEIYKPHVHSPESAPKVRIDLHTVWDNVTINGLYVLMKKFFSKHVSQSLLKNVEITKGSVHILYYLSAGCHAIELKEIVNHCYAKVTLMKYIGIHGFEINKEVIVLDGEEDEHYTFECGLLEAARDGNNEAVQFLVELGIDMNHVTEEGQTPLTLAITNGHGHVAETLISAGANVNPQVKWTPLAIAVKREDPLELTRYLLDHGAHCNVLIDGTSILDMTSHEETRQLLYQHNAMTTQEIPWQKQQKVITPEKLLEPADVTTIPQQPDIIDLLMDATLNGDNETVQSLLKRNPTDVNILDRNGRSLLIGAVYNSHLLVLETLMMSGADIDMQDEEGCTPLMIAALNGNSELVGYLFSENADLNVQNKDGFTALMLAAVNGHLEVVKNLLMEKANPNMKNKNERTALILMCIYPLKPTGTYEELSLFVPIFELLLDANASPIVTLSDGRELSSLTAAAYFNNLDAINVLISRVEFSSEVITHALTAACYAGNQSAINALSHKITDLPHKELLLSCAEGDTTTVISAINESNFDPDTPLVCGFTPLMVASSCGHIELIDALIQAGADINLPNDYGHTPLDVADYEYICPPDQNVISMLAEHGAIHENPINESDFLYQYTTHEDPTYDGTSHPHTTRRRADEPPKQRLTITAIFTAIVRTVAKVYINICQKFCC